MAQLPQELAGRTIHASSRTCSLPNILTSRPAAATYTKARSHLFDSSMQSPELLVLEPPVAIVHSVDLREWANSKPTALSRSTSRSASPFPADQSRPTTPESHTTTSRPPSRSSSASRILSSAEFATKSEDALSWFRDSREINRSLHSSQDVHAAIRELRRFKTGAAPSKRTSMRGRNRFAVTCALDELGARNRSAGTSIPDDLVVHSQEDCTESSLKQTKRKKLDVTELWGVKAGALEKAGHTTVAKPIQDSRPRTGSVCEGVRVGHSDLLQRLAQKKWSTVE